MKALYVMRSKQFEQGYASEAMQAARRFIERVFVRASSNPPSTAAQNESDKNFSHDEEELLREYRKIIATTREALAKEVPPTHPYRGFRVHGSIVKQLYGLNALSFTFSLY